jgi:hypothetical protein
MQKARNARPLPARTINLNQYGFGLNRQIQPKPMKLIAKI